MFLLFPKPILKNRFIIGKVCSVPTRLITIARPSGLLFFIGLVSGCCLDLYLLARVVKPPIAGKG
jgi:hypothetical protein